MATATGPSLAHRSISNIKSGSTPSAAAGGQAGGPDSPHTPLRTVPSTFGSPSSLRADDETIVIELGTRRLRVGFGGDAVPKGLVEFGPDQQRRVGDFRVWEVGYRDDWTKRATGRQWGRDHELWHLDVRGLDLRLVGDRIERALREAFSKFLLIDSRPRRMILALPSAMPMPLLSTVLDTLFTRFQTPSISLLSSPVMTAVAGGVRSALVVDLGWSETVVTSIYEYREVQSNRSVRGGRMLMDQLQGLLKRALSPEEGDVKGEEEEHIVSFEECEQLACRMLWCKPSTKTYRTAVSEGLATVAEQDESAMPPPPPPPLPASTPLTLQSAFPPVSLDMTYEELAEPAENTFFAPQFAQSSFDDHELPVHLLVYRGLMQLPLDVRAICMSRIIFTGGCANVLGLRGRIFDEVAALAQEKGWDPVQGKGVEQLKANPKLHRRGSRPNGHGPAGEDKEPDGGGELDGVWHDAANMVPEVDPVEEQLRRGRDEVSEVRGELRAIESLGAWSGASLLSQLKVPAVATIDRELWLQQGAAGASRASDVDHKVHQRQSMGAGGLIRGAASSGTSWTLGIWGAT